MNLVRIALGLLAAALAAGCAGIDPSPVTRPREDVLKKADAMRTGPAQRPRLTETSFAPALRCMDLLFVGHGVRDLVVLVEDLPDRTHKVNAGGKDMVISAVSQMTRRSRAIQLIAFSASDNTLREVIERLALSMSRVPAYAIRGSVSQFDEAMVKNQSEAGVALGPLSGGAARQAGASMLALDLNMIGIPSLALIPGVTSKNSVLVVRDGTGADAELEVRKFGLNFNFSLARAEGNAQALRTLAELATIELFGKLAMVPYWTCLGIDDRDPAVAAEIADWWETLVADPPRLFTYLQTQMRARGLYDGAASGVPDPALLQAVQAYQQALGLTPNAELDYEFFRRYLAANHAQLEKTARAALAAQAPKAAPAADPSPLPTVTVRNPLGATHVHRRGEAFSVDVEIDRDGFLYCYLLDEHRKVNPFFPNPISTDPAVRAGTRLRFPGNLPFRFVANAQGVTETVTCFAVPASAGTQPLAGFTQARDVNALAAAFQRAVGARFAIGSYDVRIQ
jgi:peptidoglycan hydrolase-like protein with peptidoglycan-binding domain